MLRDDSSDRQGWRNADTVCALTDNERHLGHILRVAERWHAFDATRFNDDQNGFLFLGSYRSLTSAKRAVDEAVNVESDDHPRWLAAAG